MTSSNFYFQNFQNSMEQSLIEDLVIESIAIYGHQVYYCPRTLVAKDDIYGEDTVSEYKNAYNIDMYIRSYDSYEGDGTFLSKFNLEIRDQMTFTVARRTFANEIGTQEFIDRPQEGDLIMSPMTGRIMVIKYVNNQPIFYQMGALQVWDLVCETWEYSNERLSTGIDAIDSIEREFSFSLEIAGIMADDGFFIVDNNGFQLVQGQFNYDNQLQDVFADNDEIEAEGADIIDWSKRDPFSENIGFD